MKPLILRVRILVALMTLCMRASLGRRDGNSLQSNIESQSLAGRDQAFFLALDANAFFAVSKCGGDDHLPLSAGFHGGDGSLQTGDDLTLPHLKHETFPIVEDLPIGQKRQLRRAFKISVMACVSYRVSGIAWVGLRDDAC